MRAKSVYCVECICGQQIESETTTLTCPRCQRLVEIEWPARQDEVVAPEQPNNVCAAA